MAGNRRWMSFFKKKDPNDPKGSSEGSQDGSSDGPPKWSMGVLNDKRTIEVPGKQQLLSSSVLRKC